jgi:hypothetical protein
MNVTMLDRLSRGGTHVDAHVVAIRLIANVNFFAGFA